jgi:hypothetical protein
MKAVGGLICIALSTGMTLEKLGSGEATSHTWIALALFIVAFGFMFFNLKRMVWTLPAGLNAPHAERA